jgi:hypothetical protein
MATPIQPKQNRFCALAGADITADELEFANAIQAFKRRTGKAFPLWTEELAIARELGYLKVKADRTTAKRGAV